MELQTCSYYKKIADSLRYTTKALINGKFVEAVSGKSFVTVNPANGQEIVDITSCDEKDVEIAVQAARKAFEDRRWSGLSPEKRKEILIRFSNLILEHQEELAVMESLDSGKPIFDTLQGDVPDTALTFSWHAEAIDKLEDVITAGDGEHCCQGAAWSSGSDFTMEFSYADGGMETCTNLGFRELCYCEAGKAYITDYASYGGIGPGGRGSRRGLEYFARKRGKDRRCVGKTSGIGCVNFYRLYRGGEETAGPVWKFKC